MLHDTVLMVLGLLVGILVLATIAIRVRVPYAIMLVLGGTLLGFIPALPDIHMDPELILILFLPPLIYFSAWTTSWRDFKTNLPPISLLAIGLVLVTMVVVAFVAHMLIPNMPWSVAFVLGAVVSPTDTVAATAVVQSMGISRQIVTIIEGESLVNDATGLVVYKFAVAAVVSGTFSLWQAGWQFVLVSVGGILLGLLIAWLVSWLHKLLDDPTREILMTLLTPYAAYLLAEAIGVSGVLATVASGLYLGRKYATLFSPSTRLQADAFWNILIFIFNGLVFLLLGMQLHTIVVELSNAPLLTLILYGLAVSLAVIVARAGWILVASPLLRLIDRAPWSSYTGTGWKGASVVAWAGIRGGVSLAAALAIPEVIANDTPFPERSLVIFLTYCVIFFTLIVQGLGLPFVIRLLGIPEDNSTREEIKAARWEAALASLKRLEELEGEGWIPQDYAERLHYYYERKLYGIATYTEGVEEKQVMERFASFQRLRHELIQAERAAVVGMRNRGAIGDEALRVVERDLDLEDRALKI